MVANGEDEAMDCNPAMAKKCSKLSTSGASFCKQPSQSFAFKPFTLFCNKAADIKYIYKWMWKAKEVNGK